MKKAFTLAEGATHVCTFDNKRKFGFTLAEVLITIGIIGVISVLLMTTISQVTSRVEERARKQVETKLTEVMKVMNAKGILQRTSSTEEFVDLLEKNLKIIKKCDADNLKLCFSDDVLYYMTKDETQKKLVKMSDLKVGTQLGQLDNDTENVGLVLADGTSLILTYDMYCQINQYDNTLPVDKCLKAVYDTNGLANPNTINKDVGFFNASIADVASACMDIGGLCVDTSNTSYVPVAEEPYTGTASSENGNSIELNWWAGARLACENKGMRLPTRVEAYQMVGSAEMLQINNRFWLNEEISTTDTYAMGLYASGFLMDVPKKSSSQYSLRCVK